MVLAVGVSLAVVPRAFGAPEQDPPEHPFLTYEHPEDWTLRATLRVRGWQNERDAFERPPVWNFTTAAVIFPLVDRTSAAHLDPASAVGELRFNDRVVSSTFTPITGYPGGATYARFDAQEVSAREMTLEVTLLARAWRTKFDEEAALSVGWPTGEWPAEAASAFTPQAGVEVPPGGRPDDAELDRLLERWTDGNDPKSIPPVTLAKWLAAKVIEHVQPSSDGLNRGRYRLGFEGFQLQGAPVTARTGRGSPFDMTALLAAVYRRAGLPARVVICYREVGNRDNAREREQTGASRLRAYVEFYLYDEPNQRGGWIPVDIVEIRRQSSRARPIDEGWEYFGSHRDLDLYIPLAFHFHPPTTVRSYGSPSLWGWFITPTPPTLAYQQLDVTAYGTPVRADGPVLPGDP